MNRKSFILKCFCTLGTWFENFRFQLDSCFRRSFCLLGKGRTRQTEKIKSNRYTLFVLLVFCMSMLACKQFRGSWKTASRVSAKLAPLPEENQEAVIQIYAAPLWGWRGYVADHTWIAVKAKEAVSYTVYEVIGWRMKAGYDSVLRVEKDIPDRLWFGKKPKILFELLGETAETIIKKIDIAVSQYPYKNEYAIFGPNSNTFIAWVLCKVPELDVKLSFRAVGKDHLENCENKRIYDISLAILILFENSCLNEIPAFAGSSVFWGKAEQKCAGVPSSGGRLNKKSGKLKYDQYTRILLFL